MVSQKVHYKLCLLSIMFFLVVFGKCIRMMFVMVFHRLQMLFLLYIPLVAGFPNITTAHSHVLTTQPMSLIDDIHFITFPSASCCVNEAIIPCTVILSLQSWQQTRHLHSCPFHHLNVHAFCLLFLSNLS